MFAGQEPGWEVFLRFGQGTSVEDKARARQFVRLVWLALFHFMNQEK